MIWTAQFCPFEEVLVIFNSFGRENEDNWVDLVLSSRILNLQFSTCWNLLLATRFWNPDWIIRPDQENLKLLIFAVLLVLRTALWEKSRDSCDLRLDLTVLRTMIRPLLTVPYFPLNLNLKKKKKKKHTHTHKHTHTQTEKQKKKKHNC